jgi:nicotinate-nucleotide adenylyltransferase
MKIGLYFGSFNPIHIGHLLIASYVANNTDVDQVWFILSPQNPHKNSTTLLNEYQRLHLVQLAIEPDDNQLKASDIEFKLPKPSYTINTLIYLNEKYPQYEFALIMGSDSFQNIHNWKNAEALLKNYEFFIYQRKGFELKETSLSKSKEAKITLLKAPLLEISATEIRNLIKEGKTIRYLVPEKIREEIEKSRYYK